MRAIIAGLLCWGCVADAAWSAAAPTPPSIAVESERVDPLLAISVSPLALPSSTLYLVRHPAAARKGEDAANQPRLGAERARILLRSLTVPGWGQATLGRGTSAKVFGVAELGVWTSFVAFRVQERLRRDSYEVTARLFAGIDLDGRDEEFRRIVGFYPSSDEYNRLVVRRDAANLYYNDPTLYAQYIADHELHGKDAWAWASPESYDRYQEQRKFTRKAALRANAMLGLAIANRLLSAVHAARYAGAAPASPRSWNIECGPHESDPSVMAVGVKVRF
jgi:hypothetical protein